MTSVSPSGVRRPPGRRWSWFDAVLAVAFGVLWAAVALRDRPPALDVRVVDALPPRSGSGSVAVLSVPARLVTDLGEPFTWTLLTLLVAAVAALSWRSWLPLRLVALPVGVEAALVLALKAGVHRHGPPGERRPKLLGYFPSGHTATALVCLGALATLLTVWRPSWTRWLRAAVLGWSVLMAAALVYYRYHWLTDVIASLLLGLLILRLLCAPLWRPAADGVPVEPPGTVRPPVAVPSGDDAAAEDDALRLREDA